MKKTIDNFSTQAKIYQKYRPTYPPALYDFILKHTEEREAVWDCGTGNGQAASVLANYFQRVEATDISEKQLTNAVAMDNIRYTKQRAERTDFPDNTFDLIVVAQAIHWFDFTAFYKEVNRVGKRGGTLAIFGYGLLKIEGPQTAFDHFYYKVIGAYWNVERRHIDNAYSSVPFPFKTVKTIPSFFIEDSWTLAQLEGYLNTWSGVQHFIKQEGYNPVTPFIDGLRKDWEDAKKKVIFPIFMKLGTL